MQDFLVDPPPYAILSHRWTDDEVSYKDFHKGRRTESKGHRKIVQFCDWLKDKSYYQTTADHDDHPYSLNWAWVDTCCIDKRSSAELSEAINSMFTWYAEAHICVAHLQDILCTDPNAVTESEWFTRGWTLQELLAPEAIVFCNRDWTIIGHKCTGTTLATWQCRCDQYQVRSRWGPSVNHQVSTTTKIEAAILQHPDRMFSECVAKRMSWATGRQCTRPEDIAYSLLGIFKINMPLLYGEGNRAFHRLQLELIQRQSDQSIFVCVEEDGLGSHAPLLASSPDAFATCQDVFVPSWWRRRQFSVVQGILHISAHVSCVRIGKLHRAIFLVAIEALLPRKSIIPHAMSGFGSSILGPRRYEIPLMAPYMKYSGDPKTVTEHILLRANRRYIEALQNVTKHRSLDEVLPAEIRKDLGMQPLRICLMPGDLDHMWS
ncbi:hypothetical protein AMS68_003665 [Peltaster fructicola]|uniref:Heterokaryon incompatibility domain-containing protein n=1 Tax=Peltaster fructicola TaxID=286661 RepID=A0A6H0XU57_9PEZI|nr:hypothetical protein AMS68_003665 [Peltaster fructicola]